MFLDDFFEEVERKGVDPVDKLTVDDRWVDASIDEGSEEEKEAMEEAQGDVGSCVFLRSIPRMFCTVFWKNRRKRRGSMPWSSEFLL